MDTFPDLGSLSDQELKDLIQQLTDEEQEVSYRRRILHGKIDILRAELVNRLRKKHEGGEDVISGADVQRLTDILAGRGAGRRRRRVVARHCPECGFVVTEGANYCQKCGAFVGTREPRDDVTTATYVIDEQTGELRPVDVGDVAAESGALVIRSGGGRVGQSFPLHGERMTIGRSPDTEIFLDDVTVSRDHAVLVRRAGAWFLDDSGSLNGTYVNRRRIDSHKLEDGDELQIGKYKLDVPGAVADDAVSDDPLDRGSPPPPVDAEAPRKSLTIGAVCKALSQEFPDISISKIRYLEDQKLLAPRRTPGGYRLYAQSDVSRLRTILRLQRDEFLPLRVIRQELAAGRAEDDEAPRPPRRRAPPPDAVRPGAALRRLTFSIRDRGALYSLEDVVEETGAEPRLVAELEDFGIVKGERARAAHATTTRPSARSCARSPSSPATASPAATCACSRRRPSASRRCSSRSSRRRCARGIRSAARRRSRRSRTSPPSPRTSSICCSCATCARIAK